MSIKKLNQFPNGSGNLTGDDIFLFMDDPNGSGITKYISLTDTKLVKSDISNIIGASGINNMVLISSGNYAAIPTPDPNTLYFVV